MTPLGLAWRSLVRQPARAALGVLGVAAVGALLFDMLLLSRGLVVSFRDLLAAMPFDVRVTAAGTVPGMGPPIEDAGTLIDALRGVPEVRAVVPLRFLTGSAATGRKAVPVTLIATGGRASWTLLEGEDPFASAAEQEDALGSPANDARAGPSPPGVETPALLVNPNLAHALPARPGDPIAIETVCEPEAPPVLLRGRVAGVVDLHFQAADERGAVVAMDALLLACGEERLGRADLLLAVSAPGAGPDRAAAAIRERFPELDAFSNAQLLERFEQRDFSYFRQISFVLSSITLFFAFLLVTTLLTVSVNQRFGEIAALRAVGFSRRRVVADLLVESALFVGMGGALSLPIGAAVALWLDAILRRLPGLPERLHFFVFQPRSLALHLGLLALAGGLAALYPTWIAARLPIAATLRREVVS